MFDDDYIPVDKTVVAPMQVNEPAVGDTAPQRPVRHATRRSPHQGLSPHDRNIPDAYAAAPAPPYYEPPALGYAPHPAEGSQWAQPSPRPARRGASAMRWIVRLACLGLLVFAAMTVYYLTEQSVADTSALSSGAGSFAEHGAYLVQSGQLPAFRGNPIKWTAAHVLLLSVKFSNHGLSVRQQAHVVEFALLGGIVALNVLAWMSGWAHRRDARGRIHGSRTFLMFVLSLVLCGTASFADQYHKLYVPGRHFDVLDLFLDASGYVAAIVVVFTVWGIGSALYRALFGK